MYENGNRIEFEFLSPTDGIIEVPTHPLVIQRRHPGVYSIMYEHKTCRPFSVFISIIVVHFRRRGDKFQKKNKPNVRNRRKDEQLSINPTQKQKKKKKR